MIFPDVRISQLRQDVRDKRAAFDNSRTRLTANVRKVLTLAALLRNNYKPILRMALKFLIKL